MLSLYDRIQGRKEEEQEKENQFITPNKVQSTAFQPQVTTLYGHIANNNTENEEGKTNKTMSDIGSLANTGIGVYNGIQGGGGYGGLISGGINAGATALKGGSWKDDIPQSFFGIDNKNDSDVMQSLKGAGQGAMMGSFGGPIGMAIGAALGLGASFLDDI